MNATSNGPQDRRRRLGDWLPEGEDKLAAFRRELVEQALSRRTTTPTVSAVRALASLIDREPALRMHMARAIDEARDRGYVLGYRDTTELLLAIDHVVTTAPRFNESSMVVCPINALLDWLICMPSGYALFRDRRMNDALKAVLNGWSAFLSGPHSRAYLNTHAPDGWFCPEATRRIGMDQFLCDPTQPYWGFASWNDFFTRRFRAGMRPVAGEDDPKLVVSACEAAPYNITRNARYEDAFWIKAQPYSLRDIFGPGKANLAETFAGGSVYQAFLSAYNYHRWHAPVGGTIVDTYHVEGTYYSCVESEGADPEGLNDSQGYSAAVAARAVITIACDDPGMGTVACVFIGMGEVSSCMIDVTPGQRVRKGEELGFFQYGGSTYCLFFEPDVIESFLVEPPPAGSGEPVKVNAALARAR
ncbi:phosphatidylserine decarboxylase family protein [Ralstonia mannitolilytica]|uniref:phosphatidylserine decarboxylase family protein n=1 Tax=Ralstonia mannitolilytica TaxID=105219 RepID=UPI0028F5181B|nr:phosphatidylserine decarboxylase family protein [Ralstonia mannitolilytica]CAJ0710242.1 Phosphatidylserine decarboxylase proenzyme 2 [Ralstonia mannitolilytica]